MVVETRPTTANNNMLPSSTTFLKDYTVKLDIFVHFVPSQPGVEDDCDTGPTSRESSPRLESPAPGVTASSVMTREYI